MKGQWHASNKGQVRNKFPREQRISACQVVEHTLERGQLPEEIQRKKPNIINQPKQSSHSP
jgi:hypothetical protein